MIIWGLIGGSAKMSVYLSLEFVVWSNLRSLCLCGLLFQLEQCPLLLQRERRDRWGRPCVSAWSTGLYSWARPLHSHTCHCHFKRRTFPGEMFTEQEGSVTMGTFFSSTLSLIIVLKGALIDNNNLKIPFQLFCVLAVFCTITQCSSSGTSHLLCSC